QIQAHRRDDEDAGDDEDVQQIGVIQPEGNRQQKPHPGGCQDWFRPLAHPTLSLRAKSPVGRNTRITTANALAAARSPMLGYATNTGPSSAPPAAARPEPSAKVAVWMLPMRTPISAAVSRSWNVARMARPSLVLLINRYVTPIRMRATTSTKTRFHATDTGPMTSGAAGNGVEIDFATPVQASCSAFWSAIQAPIITSIVVSMSAPRSRRSSTSSRSAPSATPSAMASGSATKKETPSSITSAYIMYAPNAYSSPCVKLTTFMMPKMSVRPMPSSAY